MRLYNLGFQSSKKYIIPTTRVKTKPEPLTKQKKQNRVIFFLIVKGKKRKISTVLEQTSCESLSRILPIHKEKLADYKQKNWPKISCNFLFYPNLHLTFLDVQFPPFSHPNLEIGFPHSKFLPRSRHHLKFPNFWFWRRTFENQEKISKKFFGRQHFENQIWAKIKFSNEVK